MGGEPVKQSELLSASLPDKPPAFGHASLSLFPFKWDEFIVLNHGSYGSLPQAVQNSCIKLSQDIEVAPDLYHRRIIRPLMREARAKVAPVVGAVADEVVFIPNATHGINTVLRNFEWKEGDILIGFSTTYGAVSRTLTYIADVSPHPVHYTIPIAFPTTHHDIIETFRSHLRQLPRKAPGEGQTIVAVIDSITSNPGVVLPWEELVAICKKEGIWSVVDGAHSIGQHPVDLSKTLPDFWVSNCHKWLYSKRGSAILYVPKRNQHIIKTSFPTSWSYASPSDPKEPGYPEPPNFVAQFEWTGTIDFVPYLSIPFALEFREWLGGEAVIHKYCHNLAVKGSHAVAEILGTEVMDQTESNELTACMTNVVLPFPSTDKLNIAQKQHLREFIETKLYKEHKTMIPTFEHNGRWWARFSSQIWLELSDFENGARALLDVAKALGEEIKRLEALGPDELDLLPE
ncbi:PLP-dependent transferase [Sistotremastrum niveocremeum HHB9708]|uniref:PLP-dependent transferase n=2 Tax=Sistotremastraceae TaxID=3402574 RepID=A0A164V6N5_9AGAM|nr:PLP-dependent transferase [Sistotremastrum niveocremeum HHB9708]KZT36432.1 PLP-dependent transferase [Sistotremastrum suecicum HHB10207 ss-3]